MALWKGKPAVTLVTFWQLRHVVSDGNCTSRELREAVRQCWVRWRCPVRHESFFVFLLITPVLNIRCQFM